MEEKFYYCILEKEGITTHLRFAYEDYEKKTLSKKYIYNNYLTYFIEDGYNLLEINKMSVIHKKAPNGTFKNRVERQVVKRFYIVHLKENLDFSFIRVYREDYEDNKKTKVTAPSIRKLFKNTICKRYEIVEIEGADG